MFRLNVATQQLEECIRQGMFALSGRPSIKVGELLLLQLKKGDWKSQGSIGGRIKHALVFKEQDMIVKAKSAGNTGLMPTKFGHGFFIPLLCWM